MAIVVRASLIVSHIISICKAKYELQFIIFAMDDNKTSSKYVQTSMETEFQGLGLSNFLVQASVDSPLREGIRARPRDLNFG